MDTLKTSSLFALFVCLCFPSPADAHRPTFGEGFESEDTAFEVEDPDISIVLYKEVTCDDPELWMTYEAEAGFPLYIQLGVPNIYRLADYRPSLVLLHPGLPEADTDLPFEVPEGFGALVFDATDRDEPDDFYEPFTATESWVWIEETVTLPESGTGYLVAYDPLGWTGKLWVAVGTVEDFSDVIPAQFGEWMREVNSFHETGAFEDPPAATDESCATDLTENELDGTLPGGGCSYSDRGASPAPFFALLLLPAVRRLRRVRRHRAPVA
jgi:hypothetical protein